MLPPGWRVETQTVVFDATVEDACSAFDRESYRRNLARSLPGVGIDQIYLTVVCGSVIVTATIVAPNRTAAEQLLVELTPIVANKAAAALALGVSLADVTSATLGPPLVIAAPSPPPALPSFPPSLPPPRLPPALGSSEPPSSVPSEAGPSEDIGRDLTSAVVIPVIGAAGGSAALLCVVVIVVCCCCKRGSRSAKASAVAPAQRRPSSFRSRTAPTPTLQLSDGAPKPALKKSGSLLWDREESTVEVSLHPLPPPPPPSGISGLVRGLSRGLELEEADHQMQREQPPPLWI